MPSNADSPFRILIAGDFGCVTPRPIAVDRDNFDAVMEQLKVSLELPGAGVLRFHELDDFHPDRLYEKTDLFRGLRGLRADVENPETFRETAAELMAPSKEASRPPVAPPPVPADLLGSGSLLDDIVETEGHGIAAAPARSDPFQQYLRALVAPHIAPRPDPKQGEMLRQVDEAIAGQMRALLHQPKFQALEAAWRALFFLVRRADTSSELKIYILNVPKKALQEDLLPAADLRQTALYRVLVQETVATPGAEPWGLIAGIYSFGAGDSDVGILGRIALLASAAGCPFIARAGAALLGGGLELVAWNQLRRIPEASHVGLALPGFLLRLPYGKNTSPTEVFPFEEMPGEPKHQEYLWGNPAFACAMLATESFSELGWSMRLGDDLDIPGLPGHVYKKDGVAEMKPCAEVLMTQTEAEALMERGLIPLLSMKDSDRIHVAGFRSISGTPLAGRWE